MDEHYWSNIWGTIDWEKDSEEKTLQKIKEFYHAGVDFNMKDYSEEPPKTPIVKAAKQMIWL